LYSPNRGTNEEVSGKDRCNMKIGIIGSGSIGSNAARLFVQAGHEVALNNSRGGKGLEDLVAELGAKAHAATVEDAARFGGGKRQQPDTEVYNKELNAKEASDLFESGVRTQKSGA
jgi:3-hydroxyacyl-CoA dehydrogenase